MGPSKNKTPEKSRKYVSPAVEKAFAILEFFATDGEAHSISAMSRLMKLPLSSTNTLLRSLEYCGYLTREEEKRGAFRLSGKILALAHRAHSRISLAGVAEPFLNSLRDDTGLTAILAVLEEDHVVYVFKSQGVTQVQLNTYVGKSLPLHCSTGGRAILAHLPPGESAALLEKIDLSPFTPKTITSKAELRADLERVRERGYAEDKEQYALGIQAVGAPVFDHSGRVTSAIAIAGGIFDFRGKRRHLARRVKECAAEISRQLGRP